MCKRRAILGTYIHTTYDYTYKRRWKAFVAPWSWWCETAGKFQYSYPMVSQRDGVSFSQV
jgi:hypothetical protein